MYLVGVIPAYGAHPIGYWMTDYEQPTLWGYFHEVTKDQQINPRGLMEIQALGAQVSVALQLTGLKPFKPRTLILTSHVTVFYFKKETRFLIIKLLINI